MAALGIEYFYESQCIIDAAGKIDAMRSLCSFCSRMKRGVLYACARREGDPVSWKLLLFGETRFWVSKSSPVFGSVFTPQLFVSPAVYPLQSDPPLCQGYNVLAFGQHLVSGAKASSRDWGEEGLVCWRLGS